jgi:hypothetical protein
VFDDRLGGIWEPEGDALNYVVLQNDVDRRDRSGDDERLKLPSIGCRLFFAQGFEAYATCEPFEACLADEAFSFLDATVSL